MPRQNLVSTLAFRATSDITSVPNVTCRIYYGASSYTVSLRSTVFCYKQQVPSSTSCVSVFVSCSKCLVYVAYVFQGKVQLVLHVLPSFSLHVLEKTRPMRPLVLRRGSYVLF